MAEKRHGRIRRILRRLFLSLLAIGLCGTVAFVVILNNEISALWWTLRSKQDHAKNDYSLQIFYREKALAQCRQAYIHYLSKVCEADALSVLGDLYRISTQDDRSLAYLQEAVAIFQQLKIEQRKKDSLIGEAAALNNLALAYQDRGQYPSAINYYEQALVIARERKDQKHEAIILGNLGGVYYALSQYAKAIEYYEQSITFRQKEKDQPGESIQLNNLALAYQKLGQYDKAIESYEQALIFLRVIKDRAAEGAALDNLGTLYTSLGQYPRAIEYYEQSLAIRREVKDRSGEGTTLHNLGITYARQNQYQQAFERVGMALAIARVSKNRAEEGTMLSNLMWLSQAQAKPTLAIIYGKQAVNIYQAIRSEVRSLDKELRQSFLKSKEITYRDLADLLLAEGRIIEAEQLLKMLKEEEFYEFVRRDRQTTPQLNSTIAYTTVEAAFTARYQQLGDELNRIGQEKQTLQAKPQRTAEEDHRLASLEQEFTAASQAFATFLQELPAAFETLPKPNADTSVPHDPDDLQHTVTQLGVGNVALWTVVGEERSWLVLVTATTRKAYPIAIKGTDLERKVAEFRAMLRQPRSNPLPLAQELYRVLLKPLVNDLEHLQAKTLLWSLDGQLRYVPLAALHDGRRYLVERYRTGVFTLAGHQLLLTSPQATWTAAGLGVSKAHPAFNALPAVPEELHGIIRDEQSQDRKGVLPGTIRLDEQFTESAFQEVLTQQYPVVHIASHFHLQPGNEAQSFLLLGDGSHLGLDQFKNYQFGGIDLLTLSACETGVGSTTDTPNTGQGKEVESFAMLVQYRGAKAVLASLWAVEDESTKKLMQRFYELRVNHKGMHKAAALQEAQLQLLHGSKPEARQVAKRGGRGASPIPLDGASASLPQQTTTPYAHPYYWAPFILIGNGQ